MNITPQQKTGILVGILAIIGGGAFVYFDPLELDLLGLNEAPPIVQPVMPPRTVAPAAKPPAAVPKPAVAPAKSPAAPSPTAAPAAPPAAMPVVAVPAVTPAQAIKPSLKLAESIKPAKKLATDKPERAKDLDLRHCLALETDAAIAKCAGE